MQSGESQQKGAGSQLWGTGSITTGSGSQIRGAGSEIRRDPPQFNPCPHYRRSFIRFANNCIDTVNNAVSVTMAGCNSEQNNNVSYTTTTACDN